MQGIGGAVTSAGLLGMVVTTFSDPKPQAKALGAFGFASAGGGAAGTVVGGVLTDGLSWHWVFWINIPLGIVVGALALRLLRNDRGIGWRAGADILGALLVTSGVMIAVYALVGTESRGWTSPVTIGLGAVAVALLAAFFVRQSKAANPLLVRFGPRALILSGLPLLAFGLWLLSHVPVDGDYYLHLLPAMMIMPFGFGITMPSLMSLAMSDAAESDSGVTSGLFNTTQQVGGAVGLAVVATAVAARIETSLADGGDKPQALTDGYGLGFGLGAAFVAAGWLVALTVLRHRPKPSTAPAEPAVAATVG